MKSSADIGTQSYRLTTEYTRDEVHSCGLWGPGSQIAAFFMVPGTVQFEYTNVLCLSCNVAINSLQ